MDAVALDGIEPTVTPRGVLEEEDEAMTDMRLPCLVTWSTTRDRPATVHAIFHEDSRNREDIVVGDTDMKGEIRIERVCDEWGASTSFPTQRSNSWRRGSS